MKSRDPRGYDSRTADQMAAEWLARHDRGLTAAEQDEFSQWLATEPRHRVAWAECRWSWDELDRLAGLPTALPAKPDPDLLAPATGGCLRWLTAHSRLTAWGAVAAIFVVAIVSVRWWLSWTDRADNGPALPLMPLIEQRQLTDGSIVQMNRWAVVTSRFTSGERRVRLERGEAHFQVKKDAARPFIVEVAGVAVRAVGTAFNVRCASSSVEVLVTAGQVAVQKVASPDRVTGTDRSSLSAGTLLAAGECALVLLDLGAPPPTVQHLSPGEIEARLAWQPRRLEFTATPLAEIVAEFNRRNPVRLTLASDELASLRLSLAFRSDNVEGFVRLLVSHFGVRAEWRDPHEILLQLAVPSAKP